MTDRTFTADQLDEIGVPFECYKEPIEGFATELHREQVDTWRWSSVHELVFRAPDDGKAYRVTYQRPLTEHQECDRWFGDDEITATEVEQQPVTVMQWQPVDSEDDESGMCPACDTTALERCAACGSCRCDRHDDCVRPATPAP